jgi:hypothetical protein
MKIRYLLASPAGDLGVPERDLTAPFMITPEQEHPFLTLGDYFRGLENILFTIPPADLATLFKQFFGPQTKLEELSQINICSEKHGALYHIARITLIKDEAQITLAATTAIADKSRRFLLNEFGLLKSLNSTHTKGYLPKIYSFEEGTWQTQEGSEEFSCMLGEWFINYHEWHLAQTPDEHTKQICLWDSEAGNRFLSESVGSQIIKQSSAILTYYYDPASGRMLWPWHHAAGDFIVRIENNSVDVKLITARGYVSLFELADDETSTLTNLVGFLLLTTLRLRLDKLNGTGKAVWLDSYSVAAAVEGCIEALHTHEISGKVPAGFTSEFIELFQYLDADTLSQMCEMVVDYFAGDEGDLALLQQHVTAHCHTLKKTFKTLGTGQAPEEIVRSPETTE